MSKVDKITKELNEASIELSDCTKEQKRLEDHIKHLKMIVEDRRMQLRNLRKGTLAPVTITLYKRDGWDIIERNSTDYNRVSEVEMDLKDHDYNSMGISCGHIEDSWNAIWSMDMPQLTEVVAHGNVVLISYRGYSEGTNYYSGILNSPTYFYALQVFHQSMMTTKDYHHQFLEAITPITDSKEVARLQKKLGNDVMFYEFRTGS